MKLSIIIPVYNEEKTLLEIISKVEAVPINKELIIIDDCSTDSTRSLLSQFEVKHKVVYQPRNYGKGAAIRAGFSVASGDILVVQDADLEYDPSEFPQLIQPIVLGECSVVYGSRFLKKDFKPQYFMAYVGNKFLSLLTTILYRQKITDMETCYKMFKAAALDDFNLYANQFDIEPELTAKFILSGRTIKEIPISYNGRSFADGKKIGWRDGVKAICVLIRYSIFRDIKKK